MSQDSQATYVSTQTTGPTAEDKSFRYPMVEHMGMGLPSLNQVSVYCGQDGCHSQLPSAGATRLQGCTSVFFFFCGKMAQGSDVP
jgi:hypothetical protein